MPATAALKATCLNAVHRSMNAKMVDFGGWDMPVQYSSLVEEHLAVRRSVGAFDVSHMGEIDITGPEALRLTDYVTTNAAARLKTGQIHYSGLLYEHGGFVDDVLVHKVADDHYFLCVNASNQEKDFEHIRAYNKFDAHVRLSSDDYAQIAIQGPHARATLQKLTAGRSGRHSLLLVYRWRSFRHAGAHRTHRLHRRRWLRNLCGACRRPAAMARNPGRRR